MSPPDLRQELASCRQESLDADVFRTTQLGQEAIAPSTRAGRWMPAGDVPVLYTCLERAGAIAETAFRLVQLHPIPRKHLAVHQLHVKRKRVITLTSQDLTRLGVEAKQYESVKYRVTQQIGQAAANVGADGLIVPSARWKCNNLVLFDETLEEGSVAHVRTEEVDWIEWVSENAPNFLVKG